MRKWLLRAVALLFVVGVMAAGGAVAVVWHYSRDLPDHQTLVDYQPATATRIQAGDGRLLAEFATERRVFVPIGAMPKLVIKAFLAAEDKSFYSHGGVDFLAIARATLQNLANAGQNRRPVGASTITQQVAKNMLLTNEVSVARKVKEAILAYRIEQTLSKDRILEIYLNEIYLGSGSYGVAAAALNYFNKSLDQLTTAEAAYLAGLPKAPNNYNPAQVPERAKTHRDQMIERMVEAGFISAEDAKVAEAEPLTLRKREPEEVAKADYFTEEVRRLLLQRYGEAALYKGGLSVRTSLDPKLQAMAEKAFRQGLIAYDRKHGWRGALAKALPVAAGQWPAALAKVAVSPAAGDWKPAVVLKVEDQGADIGLRDGTRGRIPMSELTWARPTLPDQRFGATPRKAGDVLQAGDAVLVEPAEASADGKTKYPAGSYGLRQIPDVGGGLVAMDPHTGRIKALVGGLSFEASQFDRATQAMRQPGSSFKPFVYMAALDNGYTPASIILDAPFVFDQGNGLGLWKPNNFEGRSDGPRTLRYGVEDSRNQMTVRLAEAIGMPKVAEYAEKFGVVDHLQPYLAMSLGAAETTVLRQTTAYSMIVNGGKRITPSFIDQVQDRNGMTIFRADQRPCDGCDAPDWSGQPMPTLADSRESVIDPTTAYQMTSILQGVIERGTGQVIRSVGKPLGGKTGTTNEFTDTWFVGFSPDLAMGVYVGFDQPRTLGFNEQGASVAAPIFRDFMKEALADQPSTPFRIPPGLRLVRINYDTGQLAQPGDAKVILEAFKPGTEPRIDQPAPTAQTINSPVAPGGLY